MTKPKNKPPIKVQNTNIDAADELVRPIAIFFFFALMNEEKAIECTVKILDEIKNITDKTASRISAIRRATEFIKSSDISKTYVTKNLNDNWILPKGLDIGPWKEYHKNIDKDELISLLWTHVVKMKEPEILEALHINQGTHRYRISQALRKLGSMTFNLN